MTNIIAGFRNFVIALSMLIKKEKSLTPNFTSFLIQCLNKTFVTQELQICYSSQ
jgi:hypothetical protein